MPETNTTTNSSVITITRPQPGTTASIASQSGAAIQFQFDPMADADIARPDGSNDLRFVFEDGSEVVLSDFFAVGEENLPLLVFPDGTSVDVAQAFAGMDIDLSPAAGPGAGAGAAGSGVGEYSADAGDAIGGIDRLDMTDPFYWGNGEPREELQTLNAETLPGIPDTWQHKSRLSLHPRRRTSFSVTVTDGATSNLVVRTAAMLRDADCYYNDAIKTCRIGLHGSILIFTEN